MKHRQAESADVALTHKLPQLLGDQFREFLFCRLADYTVKIQNWLLFWWVVWKDEGHGELIFDFVAAVYKNSWLLDSANN